MLSNEIYLSGRIVQAPTKLDAQFGNGIGASVLVAFPTSKQVFKDGKWQSEDVVHHVHVYGQDAEFLLQWGYVGARIHLSGHIKSWFNDHGKMRTRVTASSIEILSQKADYYEWKKQQFMTELHQAQANAQTAPAGFNNGAPFMNPTNQAQPAGHYR